MRLLLCALLLVAAPAQAQTFKCLDAAGKVTYSSTACKELGLRDGGEIQNRIQVTPAPQLPARPAAPPTRASDDRPVVTQKPVAVEEKKERRCFTIKTAKGTATRCNDKPDESE